MLAFSRTSKVPTKSLYRRCLRMGDIKKLTSSLTLKKFYAAVSKQVSKRSKKTMIMRLAERILKAK